MSNQFDLDNSGVSEAPAIVASPTSNQDLNSEKLKYASHDYCCNFSYIRVITVHYQ
jgi:hypothetical protein